MYWKRVGSAISIATCAVLLMNLPAAAQSRKAAAPPAVTRSADGYVTAHRLGGSTSLSLPALTSTASIKRMSGVKGMQADVRKVLTDSGIPETADAVLAVLSNPSAVVTAGACSEAAPPDGTLVECDFAPGGTLDWVGSSRVDLQACKLEYSIVSPK